MTAYELGFMTKCAEAGLGVGEAVDLMEKSAAMPPWFIKAITRAKGVGSRYWQLLRGGSDEALGGYRAALRQHKEGIKGLKDELRSGREAYRNLSRTASNSSALKAQEEMVSRLEKNLESARQGLSDIKSYAYGGAVSNPNAVAIPGFNQKAVSDELANVFAARAGTAGAAGLGLLGLGKAVGGGGGQDYSGYDDYGYGSGMNGGPMGNQGQWYRGNGYGNVPMYR